MLDKLISENLIWFPEKQIGYYPVNEFPYDEDYFAKYKEYAHTEMGEEITKFRSNLVNTHHTGSVLDIGIGSGQFVSKRKNTYGYDVNPKGVEWLRKRNLFVDIEKIDSFPALTFWDSLEHIKDPEKIIAKAEKYVFVSLPIFEDMEDILKSKHFRKDEHHWYFTRKSIVAMFTDNNFSLVSYNFVENAIGREGIQTFVFRRYDG